MKSLPLLALLLASLSLRAADTWILDGPIDLPHRGTLHLYHPSTDDDDAPRNLFLHFHGNAAVVADNFTKSKLRGVLAVVNFKGLSAAYRQPFRDHEDLFAQLLAQAGGKKQAEPGDWQRVTVSSFSAGYGAVRELLKSAEAFERIDAILAADSLYASLEPDTEPRTPLRAHMRDYKRFAQRAADHKKVFILTHSAQETPYASTTETANALIAHVGAKRELIDAEATGAMHQTSQAVQGRFVVYGYAGTRGEDHLQHLRQLAQWWPLTLKE